MILLSQYQKLRKKSIILLSNGIIDEYFEALIQLSKLKRRMLLLSQLN